MQSSERKAMVAAYKERKVVPGIFALRCEAAGLVWVGRAPEVATIRNRLWFSLRTGGYPHPDVQRAWSLHGEAGFAFEVLERLEQDDLSAYARESWLKERQEHWRARLEAGAL